MIPSEVDAMLERHLDATAALMAELAGPMDGAPAPRKGESPTKGRKVARNAETAVRKRIADAVRRSPGCMADIYCKAIAHDIGWEKRDVRIVLEAMVKDGLLMQKSEVKGGRAWDNIYPPIYKLHGRVVTIREMERSHHNVHKLSYNTIRERVLAGAEPKDALAWPPTTKGRIRAAVAMKRQPETASSVDDQW